MPLHYTRLLTGLSLVDVLLRVPPLFIIDELFRLGLGLPQSGFDEYLLENNGSAIASDDELPTVASHIFHYDADFYKLLFFVLLRIVASCVCCLAALTTFLLWTKHLLVVYTYAISVAVIFFSYWGNVVTVKAVLEATGPGRPSPIEDFLAFNVSRLFSHDGLILIENYFAQTALAAVFSYIHLGPRHAILQKLWPISFMAPTLLCLLPLSPSFLSNTPVFAAVLPLVMVKFILWSSVLTIINLLYDGYGHARNFVSNFGLTTLVENEWNRLNVPSVLRTFWVLRLLEQAVAMQLFSFELTLSNLLLLGKTLLISGGETLTAVLGMTSVISYGCHYIGCFFQWVLLIDDEDDQSIGTVSAILFYILALQTGLTGLEPEKRFVRLCRNFCLLFTALLHFIHNIVNPLLMSLSASHNPALHRHIRALLVCLFLIIYPVGLLIYLWTNHPMSTWLLAVSAFSVEVIVKVIVSLLIYTLFLVDAYRSTFWEKLDDYVYYIRVLGNSVEFCFGIFLFFNGAWILVFESGGAIRAGMMGIHAYFNIWCEARSGWLVFMKRRTAVNKIESLPEASESQLARLDDVCAICYQEMRTAKITRCNHYFHGVCLRKWLYVQDRCPLCHDILYKVEVEKENDSSS